MRSALILSLFTFAACSGSEEADTPTEETPTEETSTDENEGGDAAPEGDPGGGPVEALRAHIAETAAKSEHGEKFIQVEHILIAFDGAMRSTQTRSKDQAEALTADILEQIQDGADFSALRKMHSNDPGGGIYGMSMDGSQGFPRAQMAKLFGDVGWRLEVGEVGVAPYHQIKSGFGWHIIKRLK